MTRHAKLNGLTIVEALFLILVCMFALAILVPRLARQRSTSRRISCGTHLAGIGKAMLVYANDYNDELPRAAGRHSSWTGRTPNWLAEDRPDAFGIATDGTGGEASISASLYLLVKYEEVEPELFLCIDREGAMERGMSKFKPANYGVHDKKQTDLWDFGPDPWLHCSYSYHMPYGPYALTVSNLPGVAVAADRSPWLDAPFAAAKDFARFKPDIPPFNGKEKQARCGNTFSHQGEAQNVLFLDCHVEFAKRPFCGLEDDNIYTISGKEAAGDPLGTPPKLGGQPANRKDSLLVNDLPMARK